MSSVCLGLGLTQLCILLWTKNKQKNIFNMQFSSVHLSNLIYGQDAIYIKISWNSLVLSNTALNKSHRSKQQYSKNSVVYNFLVITCLSYGLSIFL